MNIGFLGFLHNIELEIEFGALILVNAKFLIKHVLIQIDHFFHI